MTNGLPEPTTEAVLDRMGLSARPGAGPCRSEHPLRGVVRAGAVRQPGEADPPRQQEHRSDPERPSCAGCLLLADDVDEAHYFARYEASRERSPFNESVCATRLTPTSKVTIANGIRYERDAEGVTSRELGGDRTKILVEEFGYSEEIVTKLPPDSLAP